MISLIKFNIKLNVKLFEKKIISNEMNFKKILQKYEISIYINNNLLYIHCLVLRMVHHYLFRHILNYGYQKTFIKKCYSSIS